MTAKKNEGVFMSTADRIKCPDCTEDGNTHARAYMTNDGSYWCPTCHAYVEDPNQTTLFSWGVRA